MALSSFIIEVVENAITPEIETDHIMISDLQKEIDTLKEEIATLYKEKEMLRKLHEVQEKEIRQYRAQPFLQDDFEGVRQFDKSLVELLKANRRSDGKNKSTSSNEILLKLNIDPSSETQAIKAVTAQLEILERYGIVEITSQGWRWVG